MLLNQIISKFTDYFIELIFNLSGILSLGILLHDRFSKSKITGRMLSCVYIPGQVYSNIDTGNIYQGLGYFFKFNFLALQKDFFVKDVKIYFYYKSKPEECVEGIIFTPPSDYSFVNEKGRYTLIREKVIANLLEFSPIIETSKLNEKYLTCIVKNKEFEEFEKLIIEFVSLKDDASLIVINKSNINFNQFLFEYEIWKKN